jgi:K+-transporting ATPase A subunit
MTWGIPTHLFLQIHVALSLIGIVTGLIVLFGLMAGRALGGWTALFLVTTILTSITGFPLPPFGLDPPRMVGILSLILLAVAVIAYYGFHLGGPWRWVYVVTAMAALYLNCFVAVIQSFAKIPTLHRLAPTQSEPPFLAAQIIVLAFFLTLGFVSVRQFHPQTA